jgi:sec-independent protein translocase protein TatA
MLPHLGPMELVIILVIALMVFGAGKLPEVGSALGKGIKEFKKATTDEPAREIAASTATPAPPPPAATAPVATSTAVPGATPANTTMGVPGASPASATTVAPGATPAGAFCPQCGTQAATESRFCARCGATIPTAAV